jgi:class 3 adenylate cyclase
MKKDAIQIDNVKKRVKSSKRPIAIIFTDIVDSTKHWEKRGDIDGRIDLDKHNRLLFPVVSRYNGKVIKTIGDSIMATFSTADSALKASIAMQQILQKERKENRDFTLHIRIGIHFGKALVEKNDVFGDVVNIAARVEGEAQKDQILISSATRNRLKKQRYRLTRFKSFIPKGKERKMLLYKCNWKYLSTGFSIIIQPEVWDKASRL